MDRDGLRQMLEQVASGGIPVEAAIARLQAAPFDDLGFARVDHHRALRDGLPEVVLALGKTPAQVAAIGRHVVEESGRLLVTRIDSAQLAAFHRSWTLSKCGSASGTGTLRRSRQPFHSEYSS